MGSRLRCLLILLLVLPVVLSKKKDDLKEKRDEKWKKKDVRDYSDADVERLYDQWEETDDDELEPDELPEWKREPAPVDMSKLNPENPEEFLKLSKKGRTQMMFATVAGNPTERETETISSLWHSSLYNANIETQRFVVGTNRILFMCRDGAQAWDVKDFLVQQDNCESVEIEGKTYYCKGGKKEAGDENNSKESDRTGSKSKTSQRKDKAKENVEL